MVGWGGGGLEQHVPGKTPPPPPPFSFFSPATFSLINCDEGENKAF